LRFEVAGPKAQSLGSSVLRGLFDGRGAIGKFPEVACYNFKGDRRVVEVLDTYEQAQERAVVIEEDFKTLDTPEWCERYGISLAFATGVKPVARSGIRNWLQSRHGKTD
jgi:hypothetical protein